MKRTRLGRPADFKHRVRLPVFLEERELTALHSKARDEGISASTFARWAILAALGEDQLMIAETVRRPLRTTPGELAKVGVKVADKDSFSLKCARCGARWSPMLVSGGRLPRSYWQCPQGCNRP
jgi:hypothetical protein